MGCKHLNTKQKNIKLGILVFIGLIIVVPLVWFLIARLEGEKPTISLELDSPFIGKSRELKVSVSDAKSGLRRIWIGLSKDGKEVSLYEADFPSKGLGRVGEVHAKTTAITVDPGKYGFSDGQAVLRMAAWDYSWRRWLNGNQTYIEKSLTIDTRSPQIEILSRAHNLSPGGAGLAIYRVSEPCPKSGVVVGDRFFPGYAGHFKDSNVMMAFFALGWNQGPGTKIFVQAVDRADNGANVGTIDISDKFLSWKVPEFNTDLANNPAATPIDKFLVINRDFRKTAAEKIRELCQRSDPVLYWKGAFLRLPRSAPRAGFADQRTYRYKGREIDHEVHLGVDLASTEHSPVPAANSGVVVFADPLGIYGRTVVIDHGFGLFSMYSHLNQIAVKVGQKLSQGDILGHTGTTGLAGGDHLHFSVLIDGTFVNPIEWWDGAWIKNNISVKIGDVTSRLGPG
jgi:murein DD-endopeptidase MepM/ murein hydrolase activator NlpD